MQVCCPCEGRVYCAISEEAYVKSWGGLVLKEVGKAWRADPNSKKRRSISEMNHLIVIIGDNTARSENCTARGQKGNHLTTLKPWGGQLGE